MARPDEPLERAAASHPRIIVLQLPQFQKANPVTSTKIHALYKINKGGIKTDCVEFVEFGESENISVTHYQLKGSKGFFSLLPTARPEYMDRSEARKIWAAVKAEGYQTI